MPSLRRPRAIRPGARIAIAAPAGPVDPEALRSGLTSLERLGFETVVREDVLDRDGYLAGSDERRAAELMEFIRDPEIDAAPNVVVRYSAEVLYGGGSGQLEWLVLADRATGERERVPAAGLFILIGARPRTDWLPAEVARDQWGYVMTGADVGEDWPLGERTPLPLETSMPGVFAVGDLRHRSMKRVASAVGDGANVVAQVHELLQAAPAQRSSR